MSLYNDLIPQLHLVYIHPGYAQVLIILHVNHAARLRSFHHNFFQEKDPNNVSDGLTGQLDEWHSTYKSRTRNILHCMSNQGVGGYRVGFEQRHFDVCALRYFIYQSSLSLQT